MADPLPSDLPRLIGAPAQPATAQLPVDRVVDIGQSVARPVSNQAPSHPHADPVAEVRLLHTALPRLAMLTGLVLTPLVTAAVVVYHRQHPSVRAEAAARVVPLTILAYTLVAALCWATLAAMNGRRLTRGRTVSPLLAPVCYGAIASTAVGVHRFVHGDAVLYAWIAAALVSAVLHYVVTGSFESSAEALGDATTHFRGVAMVPVIALTVFVIGAAAPFPFVPVAEVATQSVLYLWLAVEVHRATSGWDRICTKRVRAAQRDARDEAEAHVIDSVPAVTSTATLAHMVRPVAIPMHPPDGQLTATPEVTRPARPTWDPTAESRRNLAAAAAPVAAVEPAAARGRTAHREETATIQRAAAERVAAHDEVSHHYGTVVPRTMCVTGFLLSFGLPAVVALLNSQGHVELVNSKLHFDHLAHRVLVVLGIGAAACYELGFLWWAVQAARNARQRTRWAVSPLLAPLAYVGVIVAFVAAAFLRRSLGHNGNFAYAGAGVVGVAIVFGVLGAYRKTANAVGGPTRYFTRLIALPWAAAALAGVFAFFSGYLGDSVRVAMVLLLELVQGFYGLTMYQALTSFDRACAGRMQIHQDDDAIQKFLKFAR
jgi:hypothetical protein